MRQNERRHSKLLMVTDNPMGLQPFADYLTSRGLSVMVVNQGEDALIHARRHDIDLILVDVLFPGFDGYDICRRLKDSPETSAIPVIFMSGMTEPAEKLKGFDVGGVDYITRPFQDEEAFARIATHVRIRGLQKRLQDQNEQLQQEILERERIAEALRESEERFRMLSEATFEGVIVHDKGVILDVNPVMKELFGYDRSELIGKNALDLMMAEFQEGILSNIRSEFENLTEGEGIRKDGRAFPVEIQTKEMPYQGRTVRVAAIRDVTWRKQAEKAIIESQKYTRNIINSSLDMIITVDQDRRIVEFNAAAERVFGFRQDEIIGERIDRLYATPQESADMHHFMQDKGQLTHEVLNRRKNGEIFPCLLSASTLHDSSGNIVGYMGISRDITELKQAQAELLAAHNELKEKNEQLRELNASKDRFFSIISHDLKNPFSVLLGFTELLSLNIDRYDKDRIKNLVKRLHSSAERLYALLENLLTWSKIQRGLMDCFPKSLVLRDLAAENIELFAPHAEKKLIDLRNDIPDAMTAFADESMINTVLRNLISNAIKFTSGGGAVKISAIARSEQEVEVRVADTGVGIPASVLPELLKLDTRYSHAGTAGEEGTGLGLILCRELVEQNGGKIWVESDIGKGATFRFTLPSAARATP